MKTPAHCERCGGSGERNMQIGGNGFATADVPVECRDCKGTGRKHAECAHCGERVEFESGSLVYTDQTVRCRGCTPKVPDYADRFFEGPEDGERNK